ncbi:MAG: alpha/beta fold hydrolase [Pirellulales bacterium]|nr:alpha/beta fold hydrolase [Pirellulales bacterium]
MFAGICWFLLGLVGLIVLGHVVAWIVYVPLIARVFSQTPWLPAPWRQPLDEGDRVELLTPDGIRLEGTYLATGARIRKGVVAFCHELNGDRWAAIPYTEDLRRGGYDVFTFDFRNHGVSGRTPGYEPLPWVTQYEVSDVRTVIDYLCGRPDADPRGIGIIGVCKGGTVALCTAADDHRVRTLVVDGACPTERMQLHYLRRFMRIFVRFPALYSWLPDASLRAACAWARHLLAWRRGCRFVTVDRAARRIRQPVLMIHGHCDTHIPLEVVQSLRDSMPSRPKLWVTPEAKHNESITRQRGQYERRIARFFNRHLASRTPAVQPSRRPSEAPLPLRPEHATG